MNKKGDFKNIRLQSLISRRANNVMTLHPIRREWRIAIIGFTFLKISTMIMAVFASYGFFTKFYSLAFHGFSVYGINEAKLTLLATIVTLITIELLTAVFLEKFFKFLYRFRFVTAGLSLLLVSGFYAASFYSSTNGLAERQAEKKDNSQNINSAADKAASELKTEFTLKIADYNQQIELINRNPQGWSGGKRTHLTNAQLADIERIEVKKEQAASAYEEAKIRLKEERKYELAENVKITGKTAKDYHNYMKIVMILQIISTMALVFFYTLIRTEEQKEAVIGEDLSEIAEVVANHAETIIMNSLVETSNRISDAVQRKISANKYADTLIIDEKNYKKPAAERSEKTTVLGFQNHFKNELKDEKNEFKNSTKNAEPSKRFDTSEHLRNQFSDFLRKHKKIVVAIKKINPGPAKISNREIKQVQSLARNAAWKSSTTVQKVYVAMQTVGFERIDENGEIIINSK